MRVLHLLVELANRRQEVPLSELAVSLNLPRASLHRLLRMLEAAGYLKNRMGNYTLGPKAFELGRMIVSQGGGTDLVQVARPVMTGLVESCNETVILAVISESRREMVYADVMVVDSPLRYAVPAGDRRPLYSGASGKVVLAFFSAAELESYVAQADFAPLTPFTATLNTLPQFLEAVRRDGVIVEEGGHHVGALAIASPVFNDKGEAFGAIIVAGPKDRLDAKTELTRRAVHEAGITISRQLGFAGTYPGRQAASVG
jgi:DNA-binding IclR family transcriptional regulator